MPGGEGAGGGGRYGKSEKSQHVYYSDQKANNHISLGQPGPSLVFPTWDTLRVLRTLVAIIAKGGDKADACLGSCLFDGTNRPNYIATLCSCKKGSQWHKLLRQGNPKAPWAPTTPSWPTYGAGLHPFCSSPPSVICQCLYPSMALQVFHFRVY